VNASCALLSGMPCSKAAIKRMFASASVGSFAEEWIRSQTQSMTMPQLIEGYLRFVRPVWAEVRHMLYGLDVTMVKDATAVDLANALASYDVVALLAHHIEVPPGRALGIELCGEVIDMHSLAAIAPTQPIVVHLGVCRSTVLIETLKARCSHVRVISSHAQVEPAFFLRVFAHTVHLWRRDGGDYVQANVALRMAMLDTLGTPP
jgi:hypothetical protein